MTNWQPIETAPKDGREFIVFYETPRGSRGFDIVSWVADEETVSVDVGGGLFRREQRDTSGFIGNIGRHTGKYATHWMPLEPPK